MTNVTTNNNKTDITVNVIPNSCSQINRFFISNIVLSSLERTILFRRVKETDAECLVSIDDSTSIFSSPLDIVSIGIVPGKKKRNKKRPFRKISTSVLRSIFNRVTRSFFPLDSSGLLHRFNSPPRKITYLRIYP